MVFHPKNLHRPPYSLSLDALYPLIFSALTHQAPKGPRLTSEAALTSASPRGARPALWDVSMVRRRESTTERTKRWDGAGRRVLKTTLREGGQKIIRPWSYQCINCFFGVVSMYNSSLCFMVVGGFGRLNPWVESWERREHEGIRTGKLWKAPRSVVL